MPEKIFLISRNYPIWGFSCSKNPMRFSDISGKFFLRDRWGVIREFAIGPLGERNKTFILVRKNLNRLSR